MRLCPGPGLLISALLTVSVAARADDFLRSGASARSAGAGGAYMPQSDGALDAMAINPAGLALLHNPTVEISLAGIFARGEFVNSANSGGRLSSRGMLPYGAFGTPIGKSRFSIGFAAMPEIMSAARWRYTDSPGELGASVTVC